MAACSTSGRLSLQRTCSGDVFRARLPRAGSRRLSRSTSRALSQNREGDDLGDSLHGDLQRAIAEFKAQQEANLHAAAPSSRPTAASSWDLDDAHADLSIPWPSNLPAGEGETLQQPPPPLEFFPTSQQLQLDWGVVSEEDGANAAAASPEPSSHIYVILFGVGEGETEGIYTLRAIAKENSLPVDTVVAFETATDAERYACLLEATMTHTPTVLPYDWSELFEFCNDSGYCLRLERAGSLMIPPDYNVGLTDWEKSVRLRNGEFCVLEAEPELVPRGLASSSSASQLATPFADGGAAAGASHPLPRDAFALDAGEWVLGPPQFALDACLEEEDSAHRPGEQQQQQQQASVVDSHLGDPVRLAALRQQLETLLPRD